MTLPSRLSSITASLSEARRFTRTNLPQALAFLERAGNDLSNVARIDLRDYEGFVKPEHLDLCLILERLRDNLHIARQNLKVWPATFEGYIDGARVELEQLTAMLETKETS